MLISGFTIIRNGLNYDFPFLESIQSLLPICDEYIINVGQSTDQTLDAIKNWQKSLASDQAAKIKIIETVWPIYQLAKREGGQILSEQTNIALAQCQGEWCIYLQADEVIHQDDLALIRQQLIELKNEPRVEALVFQYRHFYGNYQTIQTSRSSYRREIRAIRNFLNIKSVGDAQSFLHQNGAKLNGVLTKARIFHYGWVRHQDLMKQKTAFMDTLYHPQASANEPASKNNYLYKRIVGLKKFTETHPQIMQVRINQAASFDFSTAPRVFHIKDVLKVFLGWFEKLTNIRPFEFKNYRLIRLKK